MNHGDNSFYKGIWNIALPVTLQALLQSSFSVVDQVMIGQLGSENIAGIGLGGKFAFLYSVILGAIASAAGIMIAQYVGQNNEKDLRKSFHVNMMYSILLALVFMAICLPFSQNIMKVYTRDQGTCILASRYLKIYCLSFLPMALTSMASVMLRCISKAVFPLFASILSILLNTAMNYILIFGNLGFPAMGMEGAAIASVLSQGIACVLTVLFLKLAWNNQSIWQGFDWKFGREMRKLYLSILAPILVCEFLWSLGENVYGAIYGNLGTDPCAAMTMSNPIQSLMIGALSGLSQAAGIMIGKSLGKGEYEKSYEDSKKFLALGLAGSLLLSVLLAVLGRRYASIYDVSPEVQETAYRILLVFALLSPIKVQNMILGGGIIRSGGKTNYVMWIDLVGTWLFGVPLGLLAAFAWKLEIPHVYFILSLEELVRLGITFVLFRKRCWMNRLQ